jgi:hypothetical protein
VPEAALDRFDLGGRNKSVPVASKTVKSTDVAMQTTADPAAATAPGCGAGCRRDTRLVAACRGALNADRFEISDHGADGAAFSFHALHGPFSVGNVGNLLDVARPGNHLPPQPGLTTKRPGSGSTDISSPPRKRFSDR